MPPKVALGERGPVWWNDGAPDFNRHLAANTLYAYWYAHLTPWNNIKQYVIVHTIKKMRANMWTARPTVQIRSRAAS